ncbi:YciI family protein [Plantactinospora sp. ZYX-F-223]|uniref:YciI family protein n=1 Tax=Plantactinospora sp. ZYX-F-223 TaxID=3144103 RepID=UPI0031FD716E
MQQYLLSIYQGDGEPPGPEILDPIMANLAALNQEMKAAGAWVFSAGLHPASTATVLRPRDGEVLMTDGPYTEGKEHLGGFTVIRAPDLDAALEWGGKLARAIGLLPIEVRPLADEAESCDPPRA